MGKIFKGHLLYIPLHAVSTDIAGKILRYNKVTYKTFHREQSFQMAKVGQGWLRCPITQTNLKLLKDHQIISIRSTQEDTITTHSNLKLLPHQKDVIDKLADIKPAVALIKAPTRFGKSFIIPFISKVYMLKTLVLVDTKLQVEQMTSELTSNLIEGTIHIRTVQSLYRAKDFDYKAYGLLIVDEAHTAVGEEYLKVIYRFKVNVMIGLTATPYRADGKSKCVMSLFGNKLIEGFTPNNLKPKFKLVNIPVYATFTPEGVVHAVVFCSDEIKKIVTQRKSKKLFTMVAVNGIKAQNLLKESLCDLFDEVIILNSHNKTKLEEINKKKGRILLIGYKVMLKAISIPKLEVIIHIGAASTKANFYQLVGRLKTRIEGVTKTPTFIEVCFQDNPFTSLQLYEWAEQAHDISIQIINKERI